MPSRGIKEPSGQPRAAGVEPSPWPTWRTLAWVKCQEVRAHSCPSKDSSYLPLHSLSTSIIEGLTLYLFSSVQVLATVYSRTVLAPSVCDSHVGQSSRHFGEILTFSAIFHAVDSFLCLESLPSFSFPAIFGGVPLSYLQTPFIRTLCVLHSPWVTASSPATQLLSGMRSHLPLAGGVCISPWLSERRRSLMHPNLSS